MEDRCHQNSCQQCNAQVVCNCLQITEDVLREAMRKLSIRSLSDLRRLTGAGDACLACQPRLQIYLEEIGQAG